MPVSQNLEGSSVEYWACHNFLDECQSLRLALAQTLYFKGANLVMGEGAIKQ